MPSANAKAKRKQQRAQAQKSAQRGARGQCAAAGTDQQWIDNEIVAVRELEMQLERKRGLIAQAQQELDLRQQHAQVSSVRKARSTSHNARMYGHIGSSVLSHCESVSSQTFRTVPVQQFQYFSSST